MLDEYRNSDLLTRLDFIFGFDIFVFNIHYTCVYIIWKQGLPVMIIFIQKLLQASLEEARALSWRSGLPPTSLLGQ